MARERATYESYEGFLRASIRAYWDSEGTSKVNFLALLIATREAWPVAFRGAAAPGSGKKMLMGAAGAAAVAVLLRTFLGGPIGLLLTGASIASLVALYARQHGHIMMQSSRYKQLIEAYRGKFEKLRNDYVDDAVNREQHELIIDGLMSRFLAELDAPPSDQPHA